MEQEGQIEALEAERGELAAKLAEAERAREAALPADVLAAIPRCAGIRLDGLSGLQRASEGEADGAAKIIAYVEPFDGRQRFLQIAGTLTVDAIVAGPPGSGGEPVTVSVSLGPAELREAYRTALTGYYYLAELPIDSALLPAEGTVTIRARFVDAIGGQTHDAEATSAIR
jgi:hypothetical protein